MREMGLQCYSKGRQKADDLNPPPRAAAIRPWEDQVPKALAKRYGLKVEDLNEEQARERQ